ncbi:uncharacterized protein [Argopecten irradians]|uniref:uncharacterized protein n=1 Tax=Argopecten irradians TaxID=31199 RepID=UPI00371FD868
MIGIQGQNGNCLMDESDVITDVRHVCLGAMVPVTDPTVEESYEVDDDFTLQGRLRRLRARTTIMHRSLRSLKLHYQFRVDNACMDEDYISSTDRPCLLPIQTGSDQLLSIHDHVQLLQRLEQDYASLTIVAGVLDLMQDDRGAVQGMREASVSVQSTLCEMFLTIMKIRRIASISGQAVESNVSGTGLYNAVVPWCSVSNMVCRDERNFIILTQIVQYASILKRNIREIDT